jgi:hypothetical protein
MNESFFAKTLQGAKIREQEVCNQGSQLSRCREHSGLLKAGGERSHGLLVLGKDKQIAACGLYAEEDRLLVC